jgi:hypothetical protein
MLLFRRSSRSSSSRDNYNNFTSHKSDGIEFEFGPATETSPVIPDPPIYASSIDLYVWLPAIHGKAEIDREAIGDAKALFYYVYSRIAPKIQEIILPQLEWARENNDWDYHRILETIERVHTDPNRQLRAQRKLRTLR